MTKKDYEAISAIVRREWNLTPDTNDQDAYRRGRANGIFLIALYLADYLEKDNPLFDRDMFVKACGIEI